MTTTAQRIKKSNFSHWKLKGNWTSVVIFFLCGHGLTKNYRIVIKIASLLTFLPQSRTLKHFQWTTDFICVFFVLCFSVRHPIQLMMFLGRTHAFRPGLLHLSFAHCKTLSAKLGLFKSEFHARAGQMNSEFRVWLPSADTRVAAMHQTKKNLDLPFFNHF